MIPSKKKDQETGCKSNIKVFQMDKVYQQIIWTLKEHEERLDEYGTSITKLEENNSKHDAAIARLENKISKLEKRNAELEKSKKETDKFISKFVEGKITEEKEKQRKEQLLIILE